MNIERMLQKARDGFTAITGDESLVQRATSNIHTWLEEPLYSAYRDSIIALIEEGAWSLLLDSFHQLIPFGTGGRRGRVGYGPNRINEPVVAMSVQGHCNYLREREVGPGGGAVVVAFDVRVFNDLAGTYRMLGDAHPVLGTSSKSLARTACEIYAANGFKVFVPGLCDGSRFLSTPELSFAIRYLGASGGINVSASHNHPDDNGFKFFTPQGAQDVPPQDEVLAGYMADISEIRRMPFEAAVSNGLIMDLPSDVHQAYIATNLSIASVKPRKGFRVVYTPLCGTGVTTVAEVLRSASYEVLLFTPQSNFDGSFESVPMRLPNPEFEVTGEPACRWAEEQDVNLVLSTDPDADRIGVYSRKSDGTWRYFTGNDIATALTHYLIADKRGPRRRGLVIKTLVTTGAIESIAKANDCYVIGDLLVGFKFIAEILNSLDASGRFRRYVGSSSDLVIAAEESHGFLLTPKIRDKDAAGAALVLCELASLLESEGSNLADYVDNVHLTFGNHANTARNIVMRGIEGARTISLIMENLRSRPPSEIEGLAVLRVEDMLSEEHGPVRSETERHARNVLVMKLDGGHVIVRPSGTEPKLKLYIEVEGTKASAKTRAQAIALAERIGGAALDATLMCAGIVLPPSGRLLPDHVEVSLKVDFDETVSRMFEQAGAELENAPTEEVLKWLRNGLKAYGGGADPLTTVKPALIDWCSGKGKGASQASLRLRESVLRVL